MIIGNYPRWIALVFLVLGRMSSYGQTAPVNASLGVSASSVNFAVPVIVTQVASTLQAVTLTNNGSSSLPLAIAVGGDFTLKNGCVASLAPGRTCVVQVGFAPSQPGERDGVLSIGTGSAYSATTVSLVGSGLGILPEDSGTMGLWQTLLGEPVVVWYKVQQPIGYLTATVSSGLFGVALVAETGSGHGTLPAESFTRSAAANCNNCWLGVQFYSLTAGTVNATLTLGSNAGGGTYTVGLVGTALPVAGLLMSPVTQDFGAVAVSSATAGVTFSVTNLLTDAAAVTVQSVGVTGDFEVLANTTGGASCSGALAATATCFVEVGFKPTMTGERDGTLTIETSDGSVTAMLTGIGTADPGVAFNPVGLNFESVPGLSATQQMVTVTNTGAASAEVGAVTSTDPSFRVSSGCGDLHTAECACDGELVGASYDGRPDDGLQRRFGGDVHGAECGAGDCGGAGELCGREHGCTGGNERVYVE
jgi:hypothetical protein